MNQVILSDFLIKSTLEHPNKIALYYGDKSFTYKEIHGQAVNLAAYLHSNGLKKGDRVLIYIENSPETIISIFATLLAGGAFSVVNQTVKAQKILYIINNCTPKFIITDLSKIDMFAEFKLQQEIPAIISVNGPSVISASFDQIVSKDGQTPNLRIIDLDLAAIIYTSGSTGEPKGVTLTHRNMVSAANSISQYLGSIESDIILCVLPLSFDYGLYQVLLSFLVSGTLVLGRKFGYPYELIEIIQKRKITGLPCVHTMMAILLQLENPETMDLSSVRYITNTGAALPPAYIPRLRALFPNATIFSMYGLTECKRVSYLPPQYLDTKPDSVGIAIPNTEVYVVDDEGNLHERDAIGELVIRGSNVMQGYWNDPEGTAKVLRPGRYPWEKVLYSRDLFNIDKEGFLYFLGRRDDIIKVSGVRVSPKEIENVLYQIHDIVEARVIPVPDEILGNAIKAEVVLSDDSQLTVEQILAHCRANLEDIMIPSYIIFVTSMPKTDSGKILKHV
jgi:long-chain acyl-CoA synthetase